MNFKLKFKTEIDSVRVSRQEKSVKNGRKWKKKQRAKMIAKGVKMDTPSTIDPRNIPTNSANSTISKFFLLNVRDLLRHHTLNASHIQVKKSNKWTWNWNRKLSFVSFSIIDEMKKTSTVKKKKHQKMIPHGNIAISWQRSSTILRKIVIFWLYLPSKSKKMIGKIASRK